MPQKCGGRPFIKLDKKGVNTMRFKAEETMALIIDFQEKLVPAMEANENFIENSLILINGLKALEIPVVVSQQYTKGLGDTVQEIKAALGDFEPYDKLTFSCAQNEEIMAAIKATNAKNIVVCGCEAHICVIQSVIDLVALGYQVIVVEDCISSRKEQDLFSALIRAEKEGAFTTTYEAILFELCEIAGNYTFKYISKLIK